MGTYNAINRLNANSPPNVSMCSVQLSPSFTLPNYKFSLPDIKSRFLSVSALSVDSMVFIKAFTGGEPVIKMS